MKATTISIFAAWACVTFSLFATETVQVTYLHPANATESEGRGLTGSKQRYGWAKVNGKYLAGFWNSSDTFQSLAPASASDSM